MECGPTILSPFVAMVTAARQRLLARSCPRCCWAGKKRRNRVRVRVVCALARRADREQGRERPACPMIELELGRSSVALTAPVHSFTSTTRRTAAGSRTIDGRTGRTDGWMKWKRGEKLHTQGSERTTEREQREGDQCSDRPDPAKRTAGRAQGRSTCMGEMCPTAEATLPQSEKLRCASDVVRRGILAPKAITFVRHKRRIS